MGEQEQKPPFPSGSPIIGGGGGLGRPRRGRRRRIGLGALAVGAFAIGRLSVGKARFQSLEIEELTVRRLRISGGKRMSATPTGTQPQLLRTRGHEPFPPFGAFPRRNCCRSSKRRRRASPKRRRSTPHRQWGYGKAASALGAAPAAVPVQKPDHPDPDLRCPSVALSQRRSGRGDHPRHRPRQRPPRLLAGARGGGRRAEAAAVVQIKATCERDGKPVDVHTDEVVPGDVVVLSAATSSPRTA